MTALNTYLSTAGSSGNAGFGAGEAGAFGGFNLGGWLALGGALMGAVGAYGSAVSAKQQLKSEALTQDLQSSLSSINARAAEQQAQQAIEAGQRQYGDLSRQYGQVRGSMRASQGASGTTVGAGSSAEALATLQLANEIDRLTIDANSIRAANAARTEGTNYGIQGLMQGVSAENLRRSAKSISPGMAGFTSLLSSGGQVASQWSDFGRYRSRGY